MGLAAEFLNNRIFQCPGRITVDQEQYIRAILVMYHKYICIHNYANVPSMSEY